MALQSFTGGGCGVPLVLRLFTGREGVAMSRWVCSHSQVGVSMIRWFTGGGGAMSVGFALIHRWVGGGCSVGFAFIQGCNVPLALRSFTGWGPQSFAAGRYGVPLFAGGGTVFRWHGVRSQAGRYGVRVLRSHRRGGCDGPLVFTVICGRGLAVSAGAGSGSRPIAPSVFQQPIHSERLFR